MTLDGNDILYLLRKHGYNYSKIAEELNVSPSAVHQVANGKKPSNKVKTHIEKRLGLKPGTLQISRTQRGPLVKVA